MALAIYEEKATLRCFTKYKGTNCFKNKPGHGQKCKFPKTLEKIVRDIIKNPEMSIKLLLLNWLLLLMMTAVRALHCGGLQGHCPRGFPMQTH